MIFKKKNDKKIPRNKKTRKSSIFFNRFIVHRIKAPAGIIRLRLIYHHCGRNIFSTFIELIIMCIILYYCISFLCKFSDTSDIPVNTIFIITKAKI